MPFKTLLRKALIDWTPSLLSLLIGIAAPVSATSVHATDPMASLLDLSLEELSQIVVTSPSRKAQALADVPAAIFVITADDIRRSGATHLPQALRLAPGVSVAAIGNNKWAIAIRGFSGRLANKLLVLVDGRSIYTPLFSGVLWEAHDIPLENIERIEVIRGPGAAMWGANAVNGVINIITKSARDTLGSQVSVAAGAELHAEGFARQGWMLGEDTALRLYAKAQNYGPSQPVAEGDNPGQDDWRSQRAGFRLDSRLGMDRWLVEGEIQNTLAGDLALAPALSGPPESVAFDAKIRSGYLLSRWERQTAAHTGYSLQAYLEHEQLDYILLDQKRDTLDLEFQQRFPIDARQDFIWGLGYRHSADDTTESPYASLIPANRTTHLFSAYLRDEIILEPERWRLTLGSRFEHNDYTGFEIQPNVGLLWTPNAKNSLWAAVSRAVRTPARTESDERIWISTTPLGQLVQPLPPGLDPQFPVVGVAVGNPNLASETLNALDIGWRQQWSPTLSLELAGFYYRYDDLRGATAGTLNFAPGLYAELPLNLANVGGARTYGLELAADWRPRADWRLQASYSGFNIKLDDAVQQDVSGQVSGDSPSQQFSLLSSWAINPAWQANLWLRYTGELPSGVPAYATLDARLAWKAERDIEVSLVGQNLLDSAHPEFISLFLSSAPMNVERGAYLKLDIKF